MNEAIWINELEQEEEDINQICLPYQFTPRPYQRKLFEALVPELYPQNERKDYAKNVVANFHRRAGKDICAINILLCRAMYDTPALYLYCAPQQNQIRKILWLGQTNEGKRFLDYIPKELIKKKTEVDMRIVLVNGSVIQLIGADSYDANVGQNAKGIIYSEFALQSPVAYNYFRPMILAQKGWQLFISTPRGHNHFYDIYKTATKRVKEGNPDWFVQSITIEESRDEKGEPVFSREQFDQEIADGVPRATANQEYMVDFDQGNVGAYYADQMSTLYKRKAIGYFPHDPKLQVITAWDLGLNDNNAIWFIQITPQGPVFIDYESAPNIPLTEWVRIVKSKPYNYYAHIGPHDINVRESMSGFSRLEMCRDLDFFFEIAPKLPRAEGIAATRALLVVSRFDEEKCSEGIESLVAYQREFDSKLQNFKDTPKHDKHSHGCLAGDTQVMLTTGLKDISEVIVGDRVKLGDHSGLVTDSTLVGVSDTLTITMGDGRTITATPEHKFFTTDGLRTADTLRYNDVLLNEDDIPCRLTNGLRAQLTRDKSATDLTARNIISKKATATSRTRLRGTTYTERCGRTTMDAYLEAFTFTTRIMINPTTDSRTLSYSVHQITPSYTEKQASGSAVKRTYVSYNPLTIWQNLGTVRQKVKRGTRKMLKPLGIIKRPIKKFVSTVKKTIERISQIGQNTARINANRITDVKRTGSIPVYDLTIEHHHAYIANGILVSNSDSIRTFAVVYDNYRELNSATQAHYVKMPGGERKIKGGKRSLPPLVMGGRTRFNRGLV